MGCGGRRRPDRVASEVAREDAVAVAVLPDRGLCRAVLVRGLKGGI